jgi:hypothetical protein
MRRVLFAVLVLNVSAAVAAPPIPKKPAPPPVRVPAAPAAPVTPAVPVEQRTRDQIQAAKEFSFEGITLGMSLENFLEKYPAARLQPDESNDKVGHKSYRVEALETADAAQYQFLDDVLFQVTAFYTPARLTEMGGATIPLRKLVQKLGKQDKNSPGISRIKGEETFSAKWDFADLNLRIRFVAGGKFSYISFADTKKAAAVGQRVTEKAEVGF